MKAYYKCSKEHLKIFDGRVYVGGSGSNHVFTSQEDFLPAVVFAYCSDCNFVREWELDQDESYLKGLWDYLMHSD